MSKYFPKVGPTLRLTTERGKAAEAREDDACPGFAWVWNSDVQHGFLRNNHAWIFFGMLLMIVCWVATSHFPSVSHLLKECMIEMCCKLRLRMNRQGRVVALLG
ncbi:hypothetical protein KY284_027725 [Solanum tuberosum]|nr:hypothetical protein KY284_027725 [Solanum tuberosum]